MSKLKIFDDSMKVGHSYSHISVKKEGWTDGDVVTPFGIVTVYAQGDNRFSAHTRIDFVWNGRLHMRNFINKRYSTRGLVTKATQFAKEISKALP